MAVCLCLSVCLPASPSALPCLSEFCIVPHKYTGTSHRYICLPVCSSVSLPVCLSWYVCPLVSLCGLLIYIYTKPNILTTTDCVLIDNMFSVWSIISTYRSLCRFKIIAHITWTDQLHKQMFVSASFD